MMFVVAMPTQALPHSAPGRTQAFDLTRCENRAAGDPTAIQACDTRGVAVAVGHVPKSPANARFKALLTDLFEPLLFARTGGEDVLAERVVVSQAFVEFASRRASILTGKPGPRPQSRKAASAPGSSFAWVEDQEDAVDFGRRWTAIKAADCKAYPVPDCQQRLEGALRLLVDEIVPAGKK